ncbi:MAG: hypothetical protein GYB65_03035 [Chloroflexi bacterium]|nr:hypothetical protein [Chloroflexota bacterium]
MTVLIAILITGAIVFGVMILVWVLVIVLLRRQMEMVQRRWTEQSLVIHHGPEMANYRGHKSMALPVKGNGILALTDRDLRFAQLVPRREYVIPLSAITRLEHPRIWARSSRAGMPLFAVYFQQDGEEDAIGFGVRDKKAWIDAIAAVTSATPPVSTQKK